MATKRNCRQWRIHRIWSTDWFERRADTLDRLLRKVNDIANLPANQQAAPSGDPQTVGAATTCDPVIATDDEAHGRLLSEDVDLLSQSVGVAPSNSEPIPAGMISYTRYRGSESGTSEHLLAIQGSALITLLSKIVACEGPIHIEELFRTVARMYHARATGQVKSKLQIALDAGISIGRYDVRGKFVWPHGAIVPPVRWRGGDDDPKDVELICPDEVAQAAVVLLQREFGIPLDDLPAATLRAMGFKRIGPQLAELGNMAIQEAIAAQRIRADASGFMVAAVQPSP